MRYFIFIFICLWPIAVSAHKPSDSYLSLAAENASLTGRWDIALRDLDFALGLDGNDDGAITWGELRLNIPELGRYVFNSITFTASDQPCGIQQGNVKVDSHTDGKYVVLFFTADCGVAAIDKLQISYRLFAELDPQHRGLLKLNLGQASLSAVLVPSEPPRLFDHTHKANIASNMRDFIKEGIWHIWIGFDHILFLFSLLIPSVLVYRNALWTPVSTFNEAFWDVAKVVTAFTLAHSITLSVAVLGYAELPSRWVESVIAASVILTALNNLFPLFTGRRALLAFSFGLIHGFGFASVLADLGLAPSAKLWSLLGFNLGVEIGQMVLVLIFLPISYRLSRYAHYQPLVLRFCSVVIAAIASVWLLERALDLSLIS